MPQPEVSSVSSLRTHVSHETVAVTHQTLTPVSSIDDGIAFVFRAALARWLAAVPRASRQHNVEGIHQLRVALRRVRSMLSLLKDFIPPRQRSNFDSEIKWLVAALAPVRDLDVFRDDLLQPTLERKRSEKKKIKGADELTAAIVTQRAAAQRRAHAALVSLRHRTLVADIATWIDTRGWHSGRIGRAPLAAPTGRVARQILNKRLRKILKDGQRLKKLPPDELHGLRISMKKLRYGISFFKPVLPARAKKLSKTLANLQDALGQMNDAAMASEIVTRLAKSAKNAKARDKIKAAGKQVVADHKKTAADVWADITPQWKALKKFRSI